MPSFAESYQHKCLLDISKRHLDALDRSRFIQGRVIGQDNFDTLMVSTIFAATAIEASLNDYVLAHCLFLDLPYLQRIFGKIMKKYLWSGIQDKIDLLIKNWPDRFDLNLVKDVRRIFNIRNRIVHQAGEFNPANDGEDKSSMSNSRLTEMDMTHMLKHYEIANTFLGQFWMPGSRELEQGLSKEDLDREEVRGDAE